MYQQLEKKEEQIAVRQPQVQRKEKRNKTGLPDTLKDGIERLSGYDMSDVRVHYNSVKPAQLNAHAYAQGSQIHLGSGQEKHLAHEAWHVVQQKQGRVQPTMSMNGQAINDNVGLEREADVMGGKALQMKTREKGLMKKGIVKKNYGFSLQKKQVKGILQLKKKLGIYEAKQKGSIREYKLLRPKEEIDTYNAKDLIVITKEETKIFARARTLFLGQRQHVFGRLINSDKSGWLVEDNIQDISNSEILKRAPDMNASEMLDIAVEKGPKFQNGDKQARGKIIPSEEESACWNWALNAYDKSGLRPDFIYGAFEHLTVQTGKKKKKPEELETVEKMKEHLENYRDGQPILKDDDEMKLEFNKHMNEIISTFRTWSVADEWQPDHSKEEDEEYYHDEVKGRLEKNARTDEANKEATLALAKISVRANGFNVTEGNDVMFYICMHERKSNVGYEHWWIEDKQGNVMQKFPKNYRNPKNPAAGWKGQEITYQNFSEGHNPKDFTYKIGVTDLKQRHKEIMLEDLTAIITRLIK